MDRRMTYNFMSITTVFQSYQDNGRIIMKGLCSGTPFTVEKMLPEVGLEPGLQDQ